MKRRARGRPLWGGGYAAAPGEALAKLSLSHPFDRRLAKGDIAGTRAHARALHRAGLLTKTALSRIEKTSDSARLRLSNIRPDGRALGGCGTLGSNGPE